MTLVSVLAGAALVAVVAVDLALTVLHPTVRGPLSYRAERLAWLVLRVLARGPVRAAALSLAGPAAMLATLATWIGLLWVGYALVYLPYLDSAVSYDPAVPPGARGALDALYLSGVALTTVGFGDVVATNDALRLVTVAEAASGFAVISGAISYLLSVYPQVSVVRSAATRLTDGRADTVQGAARLVIDGGPTALASLQDDLIGVHQSMRRFPVLYYFHGDRDDESLLALMRAGVLVSLTLTAGVRAEVRADLRFHARALPTTVDRIVDDLAHGFVGGRGAPPGDADALDDAEASRALEQLRTAVAGVDGDLVDARPAPGFADAAARYAGFLHALARRHRYRDRPLFEGVRDEATGGG